MSTIDYLILSSATTGGLETAVEAKLAEGYTPVNGVGHDGTNYIQAVAKTANLGGVSPFVSTYVITAVTTGLAGAASVTVDGDQIINFPIDFRFTITGSTGKNGEYTVRTTPTIAGGDTVIPVDEAISNATVDGTVVGYAVF